LRHTDYLLSCNCSHPSPGSTLFPTRRSSDLALRTGPETVCAGVVLQQSVQNEQFAEEPRQLFRTEKRTVRPEKGLPAVEDAVERSEEHTSELQSREKLVCRLLLEKKNKKAHE